MIDELHVADEDAAGVLVFRGAPPHVDEFYSLAELGPDDRPAVVRALAAERGKIDPSTSGLSRGAQERIAVMGRPNTIKTRSRLPPKLKARTDAPTRRP